MFNRVEMPSELHRIICFIDPKKKESVQKRQSKNAWVFAAWVWGQPFLVLGGGTSMHVGRRLARDVIASMQGSGFVFDALIYEDNATGETLGQDFRDEDLGEVFGIEAEGYTETRPTRRYVPRRCCQHTRLSVLTILIQWLSSLSRMA